MSVVFDFNASLNAFAPVSSMLLSVYKTSTNNSLCFHSLHLCVFCFSQFSLSSVSVVFDFNASLNDVAPVAPMLFPVDVMRMEKSELLMDVFCVSSFFVFTIQIEFCECCV